MAMKVALAGLILFVAMTGLASLAFNIVDFGSRPPPTEGSLVIFRPGAIVFMNAILIMVVTLPAVLLMMVAAWAHKRSRVIVGLISIVVVAAAWGLWSYLDMAMSPYEPKRAAQWGAVSWFVGGLTYIVPSYLLVYFLLRRTRVMAPLLGPPPL